MKEKRNVFEKNPEESSVNFVFNHFMLFDNSSKDLDTISQSSRLFHLNKKE